MTLLSILLLNASEAASDFDYKLLATLVSSLSGAVIGGAITIWYKSSEIKRLSEGIELQSRNLDLQKQVFEENKSNNEQKIKAELVKLEDLSRQYKLSLQKYDFEHLSKILEFADDKDEKAKMMREFSEILLKHKSNIPSFFSEPNDYDEFIVDYTYDRLEDIKKEIELLLSKYPDVFVSIHKDFRFVANQAGSLIHQAGDMFSWHDQVDKEEVTEKLFNDLLSLYEKYNNLIEIMQEQFHELDAIKRNYIKSQFIIRTQE
ncbi:hypothetical protein [Flavobacterium hydatis]|uniref:Uncharacterized protein n=1 Tax=Flavobacterium hydatis TaxID=991 RepID=A0A085ZGW6_FLAHY|nr:hypothetical protein [Flavobacterium hydatis]KFF03680.1 hypothetical protein IW20_24785 [Flavobacterium hydatis]OXA92404.1 hypothetical protein B0A62_15330 [Flavobacterium hydatis]